MITALLLFVLASPAPDPALVDWRERVIAAKSLRDPAARSEAELALLREALHPREVRLSGTTGVEHVEPADNEPAPVVNYDPNLNLKQSARPRSGGATRSLAKNAGYYFSYHGVPHIVLGPAGIDPRSPAFTRLIAEHELFHAENHVGDRRPMSDRELETWSTMFVRYFDEIHPFRQRWAPMLHYYDRATPTEQEAAVARLTTYYREASPAAREAFLEWLERRKKDKNVSGMIAALDSAVSVVAGDLQPVAISSTARSLLRSVSSAPGRWSCSRRACSSRWLSSCHL